MAAVIAAGGDAPRGHRRNSTDDRKAKRLQVSNACSQCREKKVKCTGTYPTCTRCDERGETCKYDVIEGTTKMNHLKGQLITQSHELERSVALLEILRDGTHQVAYDALRRLRTGHTVDQILFDILPNQPALPAWLLPQDGTDLLDNATLPQAPAMWAQPPPPQQQQQAMAAPLPQAALPPHPQAMLPPRPHAMAGLPIQAMPTHLAQPGLVPSQPPNMGGQLSTSPTGQADDRLYAWESTSFMNSSLDNIGPLNTDLSNPYPTYGDGSGSGTYR